MRKRLPAILAVMLAIGIAPFVLAGAGGVAAGVAQALRGHMPDVDTSLAIARGRVNGIRAINKFGQNTVITTATDPEDLWSAGGLHVPPTAARIHALISGDDEDGGSGTDTGALTVFVQGLDASHLRQSETVTLNGSTGSVNTVGSYTRIFRMQVMTAGSSGTNIGVVSATAASDGTVTAEIAAMQGITHMSVFSVPAGETGYLTRAYFTMDGSGGTTRATVSIKHRINIDTANPVLLTQHTVSFNERGTSARSWTWNPYKAFPGPCDVFMRVEEVTGTVSVNGGFDMVCVVDQ